MTILCEACDKYVEKYSTNAHGVNCVEAKRHQTSIVTLYKYITKIDKGGKYKQIRCHICHHYTTKIKEHLQHHHSDIYKGDNGEKLENDLEASICRTEISLYSNLYVGQRNPSTKRVSSPSPSPSLSPSSSPSPSRHRSRSTLLSSSSHESLSSPPRKYTKSSTKRVADSFSVCRENVPKNTTSILDHKIPLTSSHYSSGICEQFFNNYYSSSEFAINDFKSWSKTATNTSDIQAGEITRQLVSVWRLIDPELAIFPTSKLSADSIERFYFSAIFETMKNNRVKDVREKRVRRQRLCGTC